MKNRLKLVELLMDFWVVFTCIALLLLVSQCYPSKPKPVFSENVVKDSSISIVLDTCTLENVDMVIDTVIEVIPQTSVVIWTQKDSLRQDSLQRVQFRKITKRVNGGYNGWEARLREWERIKRILGDSIR